MRHDHLLLQWLSIDQALENLRSMTRQPIAEEDLISLCEEGVCAVYIDARGLKGGAQVASIEEVPQSVYGAGKQRILNSGVLRGLGSTASLRLTMVGPVLSDDLDDYQERERVWETLVARESLILRFKTSEIHDLVAKITGSSGKGMKLDPREKKSVGLVIAVLAKMADIDLSHPYAMVEALREAAALHGLVLPEHDDTIVKYLELAKK
ncbi:hypothetical protein D3C76_377140 [compost metagenome]